MVDETNGITGYYYHKSFTLGNVYKSSFASSMVDDQFCAKLNEQVNG